MNYKEETKHTETVPCLYCGELVDEGWKNDWHCKACDFYWDVSDNGLIEYRNPITLRWYLTPIGTLLIASSTEL